MQQLNLFNIFNDILNKKGIDFICDYLFINKGTIKKWIKNKKIPVNYKNDFYELAGIDLNTSKFRDLDQFYTKQEIAIICIEYLKKYLIENKIDVNKYIFIEPSVGNGSFFNNINFNKIGIDIDKNISSSNILNQNYLTFFPNFNNKYIVIGNPPFGLRGNLALRFINHSYNFADIVAFILPPLFTSDGKGSPKQRIQNYNLVFSKELPINSFIYPNGKEVNISTVFQIYSKITKLIENKKESCSDYIKIYSVSDGGTSGTTRNKKQIGKCDFYLPSTCFSEMKLYFDFENLPYRRGYGIKILKNKELVVNKIKNINWKEVAFLSTNSALNLRMSLIEKAIIKEGIKNI